jgi:hypothetical protein
MLLLSGCGTSKINTQSTDTQKQITIEQPEKTKDSAENQTATSTTQSTVDPTQNSNSQNTVTPAQGSTGQTTTVIKSGTTPQLTISQKEQVSTKVGTAVDTVDNALKSLQEVTDINMNTINSIN